MIKAYIEAEVQSEVTLNGSEVEICRDLSVLIMGILKITENESNIPKEKLLLAVVGPIMDEWEEECNN